LALGNSPSRPDPNLHYQKERFGFDLYELPLMTPAKNKRSAARSAGGIILGAKRRRIMDASVNLLTNPALDPIGKIPEYKICAVKVEAA
jgi:hypothetical protein